MKQCPKCHTFIDDEDTICDVCGFIHFNIRTANNNNNIIHLNQKHNIAHCPTCGSSNIHKITAVNKVGNVAMFGLLSTGYISKTFKCDSCGFKW